MNVLVIGGSGQTGQHIVARLLEQGHQARVLSRHAKASLPGAEVVSGSITDPDTLKAAAARVQGVVICVESSNSSSGANSPEQVHYQGVLNVIDAVQEQGSQVVLVTQIYITRPEAYPEMAHIIMARRKGEAALRQSGLPYTIVRPSWLTHDPASQGIRLEQGDTGEGRIARADVAEACVQALAHASAQGKTFELYNIAGERLADWAAMFNRLKPD